MKCTLLDLAHFSTFNTPLLRSAVAIILSIVWLLSNTSSAEAGNSKGYSIALASQISNKSKFGSGIQHTPFGTIEDIENQNDLASTNELNYSEIDIRSEGGSQADIYQQSDGWGTNWAHVYIIGDGNYALIAQQGTQNQAYVSQNGNDNTALLLQKGVNNTALALQEGDENLIFVAQKNGIRGRHSNVSVSQRGDGHTAVILAGPRANVGIEQGGNSPQAIVMDISSAMSVNVVNQ
jgi:hypothetical protein